MDRCRGTSESLAAYVNRVRPGDRCACCGGVLRSLTTRRANSTLSAVPSAQAVICPECGFEVSEEFCTDSEDDLGRLSPAA